MITATISYINRVGDNAAVGVTFSDGSTKEFPLILPATQDDVTNMVQTEVDRLNSIGGQINDLQVLVQAIVATGQKVQLFKNSLPIIKG